MFGPFKYTRLVQYSDGFCTLNIIFFSVLDFGMTVVCAATPWICTSGTKFNEYYYNCKILLSTVLRKPLVNWFLLMALAYQPVLLLLYVAVGKIIYANPVIRVAPLPRIRCFKVLRPLPNR